MANIILSVLILVIETVIFGVTFTGLNLKNVIPRCLFGGVIASIGSITMATIQYSQGDYQISDFVIFYFICNLFSYSILISAIVWAANKKKPTKDEAKNTNEEVIMSHGDKILIVKDNEEKTIVLKLSVRTGGIGIQNKEYDHEESYTPFEHVKNLWKGKNEVFITGVDCLTIMDVNIIRQTIVIVAKPGYLVKIK